MKEGRGKRQSEDDVVREIEAMLQGLRVTSELKSDHILNLLMEVEGTLPRDQAACLDIIHTYLSMPDEERLNFRLGRRMGLYEMLADRNEPGRHDRVAEMVRRIGERGDDVNEVIQRLKDRFI